MERQIPKNVRQIGNVSDSPKIYVEDYVDTFFLQLSEKSEKEKQPEGAFLIGEMQKQDNEEYIYIYGAIKIKELKKEGGLDGFSELIKVFGEIKNKNMCIRTFDIMLNCVEFLLYD